MSAMIVGNNFGLSRMYRSIRASCEFSMNNPRGPRVIAPNTGWRPMLQCFPACHSE